MNNKTKNDYFRTFYLRRHVLYFIINSTMIKLKDHYNYFFERIRLGSVSIKAEDFPFSTFLIGYYVGRN